MELLTDDAVAAATTIDAVSPSSAVAGRHRAGWLLCLRCLPGRVWLYHLCQYFVVPLVKFCLVKVFHVFQISHVTVLRHLFPLDIFLPLCCSFKNFYNKIIKRITSWTCNTHRHIWGLVRSSRPFLTFRWSSYQRLFVAFQGYRVHLLH